MSIPMSYCQMIKAAKGDEEEYQKLRETLVSNLRCGHFTTFPCTHTPLCSATDQQIDKLNERLKGDVYDMMDEKRNDAALKFDEDQKLVSELYWAGAKYYDLFERNVELREGCGSCGFPGHSGTNGIDDYVLMAHLSMLSRCLARLSKARRGENLISRLKDELSRIEKEYGLDEKPDAKKP